MQKKETLWRESIDLLSTELFWISCKKPNEAFVDASDTKNSFLSCSKEKCYRYKTFKVYFHHVLSLVSRVIETFRQNCNKWQKKVTPLVDFNNDRKAGEKTSTLTLAKKGSRKIQVPIKMLVNPIVEEESIDHIETAN